MSEQVLTALIAAGAAILASLSTQIIGIIVGSQQIRKEREAQQEQATVDREFATRQSLLDHRRQLYVDFLDHAERLYWILVEAQGLKQARFNEDGRREHLLELFRLVINLEIIAPGVYATADSLSRFE